MKIHRLEENLTDEGSASRHGLLYTVVMRQVATEQLKRGQHEWRSAPSTKYTVHVKDFINGSYMDNMLDIFR